MAGVFFSTLLSIEVGVHAGHKHCDAKHDHVPLLELFEGRSPRPRPKPVVLVALRVLRKFRGREWRLN